MYYRRRPQEIYVCVDEDGKIEAMSFIKRDSTIKVFGEMEEPKKPKKPKRVKKTEED